MDVKVLATELALMAVKADVTDAVAVQAALAIAPIRARITAPKVAGIRAQEHVKDVQVVQVIATEAAYSHATERVLTPAQIHASELVQPTAKVIVQDALPPVRQVVQETALMTV